MNEPKSKLNTDLIAEEDFEWNYCEEEFTKSLKEQNVTTYDGKSAFTQQDSNKSKISINYYVTEYENDLNCIYIELICKMYRLYIKSGDDIIDKYDWTNASLPKKYSRNKKDKGKRFFQKKMSFYSQNFDTFARNYYKLYSHG